MWRSKKMIISLVLASVLLLGSLGGIALAADDEEDSQPGAFLGTLWEKVSALYEQKTGDTLDQDALKEALTEAQAEMRTEALQDHLQNLVEQEQITQEEADQYLEWWQARPDGTLGFGFGGRGFRSMGGMRGFGGMFGPPPELAE